MLQIASGKLFKKKPGQRNELRGVLYTNLRMHDKVIATSAGRLLSTSNLQDSKTLIYELTELIEDEPGPGVIGHAGAGVNSIGRGGHVILLSSSDFGR